jgi:hypothetical protein
MKNNLFVWVTMLAMILTAGTGCQKGDLLDNPNVASSNGTVPVSFILNHMTFSMYSGGGVVDGRPGAVNEFPWEILYIWQQYYVSNYAYYRGQNIYNWNVSGTSYDLLKYAGLLETQAKQQFGNTTNKYYGLAKFFRAYSLVWLTQRVGDIPAIQASDPKTYPTPVYDKQHDVYKLALSLLDSANTILGNTISSANAGTPFDATGDIFGLTNLQWQKVVNTYKLRVLISLSKRATDNADLQIPQQFAAIVNNPTQYPVMTSNSDNITFKYNASNTYPIYLRGWAPYDTYANICKTYLNITTATSDPRTFVAATPAPAQLSAGKTVSDFTAYVGADINTPITTIQTNAAANQYSFANYTRYYTSNVGANAEPFILIGYPELCLNIAEGINRGWVSGNTATWYTNGIKASMANYGLAQGQTLKINDVAGSFLGNVTVDINTFLANVAYAGDNATGLNQILTQKYVAFFINSGWESYYQWRRTGVPAFAQGQSGIGTPNNLIPRRWQYGQDEALYNTKNYQAAVQGQYGGTDDITQDIWLVK